MVKENVARRRPCLLDFQEWTKTNFSSTDFKAENISKEVMEFIQIIVFSSKAFQLIIEKASNTPLINKDCILLYI